MGEHDRARVGEVGDALRELEPRPQVRHHRDVVAERLVHRRLRVGRVGERADRVGVDVVDVRGRQERVQERLDRRPRRVGLDQAAREVGDHLLVAHRLALAQRQQLVEPQAREVARLGRGEVGAAALDPQHAHLAAEVVELDELRRGVAAAVEDERRVGADQARARDEPLELGVAGDRPTARHAPGRTATTVAFHAPRGAATSTVSPTLRPSSAEPSGDVGETVPEPPTALISTSSSRPARPRRRRPSRSRPRRPWPPRR